MKINEVSTDHSDFLKIIRTIAKPPKRLWYTGTLPVGRLPTVAVIGTRRPTPYGREVTIKLTTDLAKRGIVIVSGLALGIDSIAHRAALEAGGTTIAVLPSPLDAIYPRSHHALAERVVATGGALLTEYDLGDPVYPVNFIARNRIVAGISDGVLVIEASAKSGTMHTAGFALEQGRAVLAVPGNITSSVSEGCNNLIKAGARAVTSVSDILEEIGITETKQTVLPLAASPEEQVILQHLTAGVRDANELSARSKLTAAQFSQTLTMLEISGKIRPLGGNKWALS